MRKMKENSGPTTAGRNKDKTTLARPNPSSTESLSEECSAYIKMSSVSPDRAGDVNLLAEDLLGQEGVDQAHEPHAAHQGLVHHGGPGEHCLLGYDGHPGD